MAGVDVSVEAISECQIQEVTLDGQEIYVHPLSMSDNLSKLAHKIDFLQDEREEKGKPTSEGEKEEDEEEKTVAALQPSLWPWHSVRNKLKAALTEMSVLSDILGIAKEKHYLVLDPVSQESIESKPGITALAKKKALAQAGNIITAGADRLKKSQEKKNVPNFHYELVKMRQKFRLKKVGNTILGDLSYKSVGSQFWLSGMFEVTKSDLEISDLKDSSPGAIKSSPLQVSIPSELENVAYIQVAVRYNTVSDQSGSTDLFRANLNLTNALHRPLPPGAHWQLKLETAQNVVFCKEVFAQLAKDAVHSNSPIPHIVVGNQIFSHLFPGIQLSIALCHYTDKDLPKLMAERDMDTDHAASRGDHNEVLEHSLHQLVRELHFKNSYHPMPHPITALLGVSKRRRLAGPHAFSRSELMEMTQSETILEQIIKQAKHYVVRMRVMSLLDEVSQDITELQIASHWSNLNSATESSVKVNIMFPGYDTKTQFALHISVDNIRVVAKDGRVLLLSCEAQELRDFIMTQVSQHHISIIQNLSKYMGWMVLSVNNHVGVGPMETVGSAQTILIASPTSSRLLSIRSGPSSGVSLYLQYCPAQHINIPIDSSQSTPWSDETSTPADDKWKLLRGPFHRVCLEKLDGRNFVNKMELIMACLV